MKQDDRDNLQLPSWAPLLFFALFLLLAYTVALSLRAPEPTYEIPYSLFKSLVRDEGVESVWFRGLELSGRLRTPAAIGPQQELGQRYQTRMPVTGDPALLPMLEAGKVEVQVAAEDGRWRLLFVLIAWLMAFGLLFWFVRRMSAGLGGRFGGPSELKRLIEGSTRRAEVPKVTFADVAGQENAKREVTELVEYLRDPARFERLGAEPPRGVLLMGPPGTGKTLLARALAGEAGVPFYSISASEFIEVFVGVGAARVRHLFEAAKKNAPSIVFMDELDSVGRVRGTGLGGGHDEREQTLNQILSEMDGFAGHEAVIVLAATNRPDVLDPALLRPGRFDRHVMLDLPDRRDREAILRVHVRKVPLAPDVDLAKVAANASGFSGADLKNMVNEAAIQAARARHDLVSKEDFDEARDKLLLGTVRTLAIQPEERHRLAVHEAGHALVAYFLPKADPPYKITIIPRGRTLGGTQQLPGAERYTLPEDYLRDRLAVTLGGRAAEQELLGSVSSGADDDIHQATSLARAMVSRWGMSRDIGPIDLRESEDHPFLGREMAQPRRYSEHSARAVDRAVRELLHEAEQRALDLIRDHAAELARLIEALEQQETLQREEIGRCLEHPPQAEATVEV
jgi:cell division protease FtsH